MREDERKFVGLWERRIANVKAQNGDYNDWLAVIDSALDIIRRQEKVIEKYQSLRSAGCVEMNDDDIEELDAIEN